MSSLIIEKHIKDISKKVSDVNGRLKNYCSQKKFDFIDYHDITEDHLEAKNLLLNKMGNATFAGNSLKYLRLRLRGLPDCNCYIEKPADKSSLLENTLSSSFNDEPNL